MEPTCELNVWQWSERFPFPFPPNFDNQFFARFGADQSVRSGVIDLIAWLRYRVRECFAYEETLRVTVDQARGALAIHVFRSEDGAVSAGFAFDWAKRRIHAMAFWHRDDPMGDESFIRAARAEAARMSV